MPYQLPRTPIGRRRARLHFERLETTDDGMGGQTPTGNGWIEAGHAFGVVTALDERSQEGLRAMQIQGRAAYHIDVAYRQALTAEEVPTEWRIRWGKKRLQIHNVVEDTGRDRRLIILAAEEQ